MKFYFIGDEEGARGFRLAGVEGRVVSGCAETSAALREVLGRGDCGVIIMTAGAASLAPALVNEIRLERNLPLVVEI